MATMTGSRRFGSPEDVEKGYNREEKDCRYSHKAPRREDEEHSPLGLDPSILLCTQTTIPIAAPVVPSPNPAPGTWSRYQAGFVSPLFSQLLPRTERKSLEMQLG